MIIKRDFPYSLTGKNRPLHIWLPEDYDRSRERYPVMYFFDGHNLFLNEDAPYGKSWGMKEFLESWGKQLIVVGIECGHEGQERLSEYLPYPAAKDIWFGSHQPLGGATMEWIIREIKPVIDRDFRTIPFRECTAIGGSSMGGIMALYAAVHYNEYFSKAACISTAMGFCMRPLMKDMRQSRISPDTRIYLSWGSREAKGIKDPNKDDRHSKTYDRNKRVADHIVSRDATARLRCQVDGGHCEADWEKLVPEFMNFLWME